MGDKQMIGRVKVSAVGGPIGSTTLVLPLRLPAPEATPPPVATPPEVAPPVDAPAEAAQAEVAPAEAGMPPDKALEVLTLAQRTAAAHVADATDQARRMLAEAEARVEQMDREARSRAEKIRAEAEMMVAGARSEAETIVAAGHDHAEQLRRQAQQRYEDAVGGLSIKREALQKQIETLESFNSDYRHQLTVFVQKQMRALWTEQPDVEGEPSS
ncbi:hypothetical protein M1L60_45675 [Actinoplanes sp. TRM 88003]|uniref:Uncharacterized protein n=1 Tax=Paractinoplanes aksuensis TaxID=2939490 RepID=A0ABT1E7U7_9ACTN|nr:hypothetical protein [Actinoplanes aksuensis]MCO8277886.1 hypothetical protein [Actinoplanes aksuensis]